MTYPDPRVTNSLGQDFIGLKVNARELPEDLRDLARTFKAVWTPLLLFLDSNGTYLHSVTGYLPPNQFLAELQFVLGVRSLLHNNYTEAYKRLRDAEGLADGSALGAEAVFYAGMAAFRATGRSYERLREIWSEIGERYPQSPSRDRADVWDMLSK